MTDEIMPNVFRATEHGYPDDVWIDNLYTDRHTDVLAWASPEDTDSMYHPFASSGVLVEMSVAQARDLHAKLDKILAEFDKENAG